MLFILPLAYFFIFLTVGNYGIGSNWRQSALRAVVIWSVYLVFLTELLSLFNAITPGPLFLGWTLPVVAGGFMLVKRYQATGKIELPRFERPENWLDSILLGGIFFYLAVTAIIAFLSPPNTFDSLNYHMARVAHWAQNGSLRHFATSIEILNNYAPGAEMMTLNAFVLTGGDRFVNFIEWSASLGCALGAALIAQQLGAKRSGQLLAAVFVVTLPAGIAQASSTMNDYVVAFWLVCVAAELLDFKQNKNGLALFFEGVAAGMAFFTKPTSAAFLLPFALWTVIVVFRQPGLKKNLLWSGAALALAVSINMPHLSRNLETYGQAFDPAMSDEFSNQLRNLQGVTSNIIKHVTMQTGTPWKKANAGIALVIIQLHKLMGLDVNDSRTTQIGQFRISPPNFNEVRITNPLHLYLIFASLLILAAIWLFSRSSDAKSKPAREQAAFAAVYFFFVFMALVVFSYLFKWQIFSGRYHLPLFVLCAPFVGLMFGMLKYEKIAPITGIILLLLCSPWLFRLNLRPLVADPAAEGASAGKSLLTVPRYDWYFATLGSPSYAGNMAAKIKASGCTQVALVLTGNAPEYVYWVALDALRSGIRIEGITAGPSGRYIDPSFEACAVICDQCQGYESFNSLPLVLDDNGRQLYLAGR